MVTNCWHDTVHAQTGCLLNGWQRWCPSVATPLGYALLWNAGPTTGRTFQAATKSKSHLAFGPGGLASMPPMNPAAKDTASGSRPTSALIRNQVGSAAPDQAAHTIVSVDALLASSQCRCCKALHLVQ